MRLIFQLRFHTRPGQELLLVGAHELFGQSRPEHALPLCYIHEELWQAEVLIQPAALPETPIPYHYLLREPDGSLIHDWGHGRVLDLAGCKLEEMLIIDSWNHAGFYENVFYTEPFQRVLLKSAETEVRIAPTEVVTHQFRIKAPLLGKGQTLCVLGSAPALANWNTSAPVVLNRIPGECWLSVALDLSHAAFPISYKYGVYDQEQRTFVKYEEGANRTLDARSGRGKRTLVNDGFVRLPVTHWKGAGVAVPVFSLRSERSFGVGEFSDLKPLADWCHEVGLKLIQILPVNDTMATGTWTDSYPYASISAFALHPMYLNLEEVAQARQRPLLRELEQERARVNALPELDYEAVVRGKLSVLRKIYAAQKARTFKSKEYRHFFTENQDWLAPYAVFSCLRDRYGTPDTVQWPEHQKYDPAAMQTLAAAESMENDNVGFYYFLQFHLDRQFRDAVEYAHQKEVIVKGDIAIGVARHSADTWQHPELFELQMQAGAPPDAFAVKGQNWGFPTYNWPRMQEDNFTWWRRRFAQMSHYCDAFRIDHILGFFRIWSIPIEAVEGILGYFVPALPLEAREFAARQIAFDPERYARPYITEPVLADFFGAEAAAVKDKFLNADGAGKFSFKPEFATQRRIERHFAELPASPLNAQIKQSLFDLLSNVLLLEPEEPDGHRYHFRFAIESTASFRALDAFAQNRLRELYNDYFFRRQESFWMREGLKKLPELKRATNMLICGEDLGLVPACVPEVMKQLGMLGLEVQRMPKRLGQEFSRPQDAPYLSVVTPSTHDMSTIRGWWMENAQVTQKFFNQELGLPGIAPAGCSGRLNEAVVQQHLASPAMWSIFQIQDLLGMDETLRRPDAAAERINVPAQPNYYWRYRMHFPIERLLEARDFNHRLRALLEQSARA
jgi:4-alpha-glucanotransferase